MKGTGPNLSRLVEEAREADPKTLLMAAATLLTHAAVGMTHGPTTTDPADVEALLTATEAALLARVSTRWLYEHARELPFARRIGRLVRFSRAGLLRWLETRGR